MRPQARQVALFPSSRPQLEPQSWLSCHTKSRPIRRPSLPVRAILRSVCFSTVSTTAIFLVEYVSIVRAISPNQQISQCSTAQKAYAFRHRFRSAPALEGRRILFLRSQPTDHATEARNPRYGSSASAPVSIAVRSITAPRDRLYCNSGPRAKIPIVVVEKPNNHRLYRPTLIPAR